MSESLKNFLVDLASDPERMKRFAEDPASAADQAGLSAEEKAIVMARDASRLRAALGQPDHDSLTQNLAKKRRPAKPVRKPKAKKKSKRATKKTRG